MHGDLGIGVRGRGFSSVHGSAARDLSPTPYVMFPQPPQSSPTKPEEAKLPKA